MKIIYLDILEISYILLYEYKSKRVKINVVFNCLKYKNPSFYKNLTHNVAKKHFVDLFPLYNNNRKNCKNLKISKSQLNSIIKTNKVHIRPNSDIDKRLFGL